MQICGACTIGLAASLTVARSTTFIIITIGLTSLAAAFGFAYKHKVLASASTLLVSLSSMLFALAATGAGLFDLAVLGYPTLIIFSAILGGVGLFLSLLSFVILQCVLIAWLSLQGIITPNVPALSVEHLIFILVIFVVTGFSVYILVSDIKRLMISLQHENQKVEHSRVQIQHLAHHDNLTNLPNRLYGETLFTQSLNHSKASGQSLALLFIDLDNFKPVNDALGHAAGDQLLKLLTQKLNEFLLPEQYLIRFGGDEFIIITPINPKSDELSQLSHSVIQQCASVFTIFQTQVTISASLGTSQAPRDGNDFKQLCRKADIAMYKAKQDGRNTYHHYDENLDQASENKFKMLQRLRPALSEQRFELYYQPIVDLQTNKINTLEALLRWPQSDGSMIPPDLFVPLAESSGLINELGDWVIRQATQFCGQLRRHGNPDMRIAVNLSVMQFKDGQLQRTVESALYEAGLPPEALELELTESLLIDETDQIQKQLASLSQLGITIAIDDFGTGYSNLGYLRSFNAAKLKIDRSFITPICVSKHDESLVEAIINMASSLGLMTIAEGIEDEATLQKLLSLGCDIGQGYYWAKPLPEKAIIEFLLQNKS